jgi:hypothetical protein
MGIATANFIFFWSTNVAFCLLKTLDLNLMSFNKFDSIHAGLLALAHDIGRIFSWVEVSPEKPVDMTVSQPR